MNKNNIIVTGNFNLQIQKCKSFKLQKKKKLVSKSNPISPKDSKDKKRRKFIEFKSNFDLTNISTESLTTK